ncbi:hypothetical protein SRHO_G00338650 [Serrasalmus rhombeus]
MLVALASSFSTQRHRKPLNQAPTKCFNRASDLKGIQIEAKTRLRACPGPPALDIGEEDLGHHKGSFQLDDTVEREQTVPVWTRRPSETSRRNTTRARCCR